MVGNLLGYSEGRKTTGLSYKFFIFPPLQATTFNFWPSFLASYMGPQYKIVYSITLRGYFVLDGQGYKPSILVIVESAVCGDAAGFPVFKKTD